MTRLAKICLTVLLCHLGSVAVAEDVVSRFLGVWVGEGQVRPDGFGEPEKTRCKVIGSGMTATQISYAGRCATATGAGGFRLLLAQDADGRLFSATARLGDGGEAVAFAGHIDRGQIELRQKAGSEPDGNELSSVIYLAFPDAGRIEMRMQTSNSATGEQAQSLDLLFLRTGAAD